MKAIEKRRAPADIGNELHNLACNVVHTDELLAIKLGELALELWGIPNCPTEDSARLIVGRELDMHLQTAEVQNFVGAAIDVIVKHRSKV